MTGAARLQLAKAGDAFVARWQGVAFEIDARGPDAIDCWGLACAWVRDVLHQPALPDWRAGDHGRAWIAQTMEREARAHWRPCPPRDGCLVIALRARAPNHIGIVWRGSVLHADEGRGQVILERLADFAQLHPTHSFGDYVP